MAELIIGLIVVPILLFILINRKEETVDFSYIPNENDLKVLDLVNLARKNKLELNEKISKIALEHSNYILKNQKASHDNFGKRQEKLKHLIISENVAFGYNSIEAIIQAWLNSPKHKANILDEDWTETGIATVIDSRGRFIVTQIFAKY